MFLMDCQERGIPRGPPRRIKRFQDGARDSKVFTGDQEEEASPSPANCGQRLQTGGERESSRNPQKHPMREKTSDCSSRHRRP